MISSLVLCLVALGTFASSTSASEQAAPAVLVDPAVAVSTLTLSITLSPSASGAPTSGATLTITISPTPTGPAFTSPPPGVSPQPAVPDDNPPCASLDALVSSCTTLESFYGLPLSGQAQCLCNVGPWDAVAAACFEQLTVLGQYYASSLTSHGLLGLCSTYGAGPTWPTSVITSISAMGVSVLASSASAASPAATETSMGTTAGGTGSATGSAMRNATQYTGSATQSVASGSGSETTSSSHNAAPALAQPSCETWVLSLVWLLPWLLGL